MNVMTAAADQHHHLKARNTHTKAQNITTDSKLYKEMNKVNVKTKICIWPRRS